MKQTMLSIATRIAAAADMGWTLRLRKNVVSGLADAEYADDVLGPQVMGRVRHAAVRSVGVRLSVEEVLAAAKRLPEVRQRARRRNA